MLTSEIELPAVVNVDRLDDAVESCCLEVGLDLRFKTSVKKHPASVHWHFGRRNQRGTLEVTLLVREKRLSISVHTNRAGAWTDAMMIELKSKLETELAGRKRVSRARHLAHDRRDRQTLK